MKKENKKTNNLLYILYKLNFEDIDNFNNLWSEIYDKIKKILLQINLLGINSLEINIITIMHLITTMIMKINY